MAVDLRDTYIDPARSEYRKMLENLQANILKPHGRKESDHLLVRFAAGPETVRAWIREFARREVTSARKQLDETGNYHDHGTRGGLVAGFALSAAGYGALGLLPEDFGGSGQSFREGMKRRAFSVIARNRDPPSNEWEGPYQGDIHALVSLSHDSADELSAKTREVSEGLRAIAEVLTIERGTVLRNARGDPIEHFGYVDSRSQPLFLQADLNPEEERSHRIVRRGVPYGVRPAPSSSVSAGATANGEVGLLFQAFQSGIARQFEFIQRTWVDNPNFPELLLVPGLNTGDDALIGQHPRAAQKWPRTWGRSGRFLDRLRFNFGDYVRLRGGEYFFAPSLSFLKNL